MADGFVKVCDGLELVEGAVKTVSADEKLILLARYRGIVYAVDDICTHDGGELGDGDLVDGQVQCPRHGARFDLKTGDATRMPAIIGIGTYDVKVENGQIFVAVGD